MLNSMSTNSLTSGVGSDTSGSMDHKEPYELVIDKTLRSQAKRMQDNTREELGKVLERVENVYIT